MNLHLAALMSQMPRCPNCLRRHQASICYYCGCNKETIVPKDKSNRVETIKKVNEGVKKAVKEAKPPIEDLDESGGAIDAYEEMRDAKRKKLERKTAKAGISKDGVAKIEKEVEAEFAEVDEMLEAHQKRKALKEEQKKSEEAPSKPKKATKAAPAGDTAETKSDDDMLTVSDVAREMKLDPKVARAKLRRGGARATEGRWPKVKRGSAEHDKLIALLAAEKEPEAETDDAGDDE